MGRIALLRVTSVSSKDAADWNRDHLEYTALVWNDPNAMTQYVPLTIFDYAWVVVFCLRRS